MPSEIATTTHNYNYINKSRSKTKKRTMGGFRRPWNSTSMSSTTRTSNTITGKSTTKSPSSKPLLSSPAESSSSSSSSDNGNGGAGRLQMMTAMIIPPSPLAGNSNHRRVHPAATAGNSHSYTAKKDCLPSPLQTEEEEEEQPAAVTPVSSASSSNSFSDYHSPTTSSSGAPAPLLSATPKNKNTETQSHDTEQKDTEQKDTGTVTPTADKQQQEQDLSTTPKSQSTTASRTTTTSTSTSCSKALEFSAKACDCLAEQDWIAALHFYQQALDIYEAAAQQPLSIVDACNAASTLHNMAAVYRVLKDHPEESLSNYHDAEQLYRECYQRILLDTTNNAKSISTLSEEQLEEHEDTVCLPSLVAETLQHRATIYETSSVWDTVAALECHEACIEWLLQCQPKPNNNIQVTCLEDIYFLRTCTRDNHMELLTNSYKALAKLYRNTDSPQDGLQALLAWKQVVEEYLQQQKDNNNNNNKWHKNLVECYKMLSEYYLAQKDTTNAMKTLQSALDMQLQMQRHNKHKKSNSKSKRKEAGPAADAVLSPELMQQMNALGQAQEESGEYEEALQCYEKILLLTSQYLGEDHWEVAETLVKIGRVMEQQGNLAGGLDLYQAAHTIYQAAIKKDSGGENNTSHIVLEVDDDYDYEQALNTRAATESVVRIANVLMSQKRWQEAVDFLRELPQAKEWLAWLDDCNKEEDANTIASIKSKKGHVVQNNNKSNDGAAPAKPSVDQAIVFRELGRAYLGMGSLAKAKQCLLESARRLEGTDHEEDVFELLMHVEFCQKEEEKESRGRRRRSRSRSVSRARSRSRHSRSNSAGSSSEETARVVAAVLSPPSSGTVSSNAQDKMKR